MFGGIGSPGQTMEAIMKKAALAGIVAVALVSLSSCATAGGGPMPAGAIAQPAVPPAQNRPVQAQLTAEEHLARGILSFERNEFGSAMQDFTNALRLAPDFAEAHFWRGRLHFGAENFHDAITDFT